MKVRFGSDMRWAVFVCADEGHPMKVGYESDEYRADKCPACGAGLIPVVVQPVADEGTDSPAYQPLPLEACRDGSNGGFIGVALTVTGWDDHEGVVCWKCAEALHAA